MSQQESATAGPTTVTIFGRTYNLRGGGDAAYLQRLAASVDVKMREIARATGTADTLKVAILAALNLADDCMQGRDPSSAVEAGSESIAPERVARLVGVLDEALAYEARESSPS